MRPWSSTPLPISAAGQWPSHAVSTAALAMNPEDDDPEAWPYEHLKIGPFTRRGRVPHLFRPCTTIGEVAIGLCRTRWAMSGLKHALLKQCYMLPFRTPSKYPHKLPSHVFGVSLLDAGTLASVWVVGV